MDLLNWTPRNIPWRHPRQLWVQFPGDVSDKKQEFQQVSLNAWNSYLDRFEWIHEDVKNETFLSIPFQVGLSQLSDSALVLPGVQPYFGFGPTKRRELDKITYLNEAPRYILLEDHNIDYRSPLDCRPDLYRHFFANYKIKKNQTPFSLWERRAVELKAKERIIIEKNIDNFPLEIEFKAMAGCLLHLTLNQFDPLYKLKSSLGKGDVLEFELSDGNKIRKFTAGIGVLEYGILLKMSLNQEIVPDVVKNHKLILKGRGLRETKLDPFQKWFNDSKHRILLKE